MKGLFPADVYRWRSLFFFERGEGGNNDLRMRKKLTFGERYP